MILYFDDGDLKQVQLVSRLQSGNTWTAFYRERTRSNTSIPWEGDPQNIAGARPPIPWGAWTTTIPSAYTATNANDAISKGGYIITPSATENAPDLHRSDIDGQPVVLRVIKGADGNASAQQIRYEHFGGNSYDRTVNVAAVTISAPSRPTLTATARTYGGSIDLVGTVADDGAAVISKWEVKFASSQTGLATAEWVTIDDEGGNTLSHSFTNLAASTTYWFSARATNEIGTSPASVQTSATTSSVTSFFGYGVGSSASPYQIDPSDFLVARSVKREFDANNRTGLQLRPLGRGDRPERGGGHPVPGRGQRLGTDRSRGRGRARHVDAADQGWSPDRDERFIDHMERRHGLGLPDPDHLLRDIRLLVLGHPPCPDRLLGLPPGRIGGRRGPVGIRIIRPLAAASPGEDQAIRRIGDRDEVEGSRRGDSRRSLRARVERRDRMAIHVPDIGDGVDREGRGRGGRGVESQGRLPGRRIGMGDGLDPRSGRRAEGQAAGDPVEYEILTNDGSARLEWLGASVGDSATWWPFGNIEGEAGRSANRIPPSTGRS